MKIRKVLKALKAAVQREYVCMCIYVYIYIYIYIYIHREREIERDTTLYHIYIYREREILSPHPSSEAASCTSPRELARELYYY